MDGFQPFRRERDIRTLADLLCRDLSPGQVQLFLETAEKMMENLDEAEARGSGETNGL